jgi:xylan 1,4-beta-xylosidase
VGRGYDLLRDDLLRHLDWLQKEVGFRSSRFHAILHDDVGVVKKTQDGRLYYCWNQLDKIYDALLARGLRPFVELNPMPAALASGNQKITYYQMNVTPPAQWKAWGNLVEVFTRHLVERYGLDEVRQWNFEVWNEPNLSCFWSGTKEDYFKLYETAARAVKQVDSQLKIGGPASSKAHWLEDMINWCHSHDVPLDFISTHLYPQDEQVEAGGGSSQYAPGEYFLEMFRGVKKLVCQSKMPNLPIHWTEWNTQSAADFDTVTWSDNEACDNVYGGAFVVRHCLELDDVCDSMAFWVASDVFEEQPIQPAPFSATYGMVTIDGVPKATANAFRLLNRMRGDVVGDVAGAPRGCGGVVTREGAVTHALFYNCQPPLEKNPQGWRTMLSLPSTTGDRVVTKMFVCAEAGSPYEWWVRLGRPMHLSSAQLEAMRRVAEPHCEAWLVKGNEPDCPLELDLPANTFAYYEIRPTEAIAPTKSQWANVQLMEAQFSELSRD